MVAAYVPEGGPADERRGPRPRSFVARPAVLAARRRGVVWVFVARSGNAAGPTAATASATNTPICLAKEGGQGPDRSGYVPRSWWGAARLGGKASPCGRGVTSRDEALCSLNASLSLPPGARRESGHFGPPLSTDAAPGVQCADCRHPIM